MTFPPMPYDRSKFLHMWTVYDHPRDYPHSYVARMTAIGRCVCGDEPLSVMTGNIIISEHLDVVREQMVEWGLTCLPRATSDDPVIVECWV